MRHLTPLAVCVVLLSSPAEAQMRGFGGRMGGNQQAGDGAQTGSAREERMSRIEATGLVPVFPAGFSCTAISSPFASPFRYDGSRRPVDRNGGLHGGMDISLDNGTPLLAVADGEVIAKGAGGQMEGMFLWLRLAPVNTGLPFWTFAKYQHLSAIPELEIGSRVKAGQVVALSGDTGTKGGHYGAMGYPHLHLSTHFGPVPEYTLLGMFGSMVKGEGATHDDTMILYMENIASRTDAHGLPEGKRQIPVSIVGPDGVIHPAGARTVWPVACRRE